MDKRVSDIIAMAIKREEEASDFYMDIHAKVTDPALKGTLEFIAGEEKKHKAFFCKKREIGGKLWEDSVYRPKNLTRNRYLLLPVLSLRLTEITPV